MILNDGKLYRKNTNKAWLDLSEFMMLCRREGYFKLSDIKTAILECNGKLTVLPVSARRPVTPADLGQNPPLEHIDTEIIMDGRVLDENLQRRGLNLQWLKSSWWCRAMVT